MKASSTMKRNLATLLTDFGTADHFVGAMKGALLTVAPDAYIIDITHDIPAHDVSAGAWALANAYAYFPQGTVHVCVVDPGVGTARRALAASAGGHFFVAPDNGLFSFICEREQMIEVVELTNEEFFRQPVSRTFHGRDVFAPIAGAILNGIKLEEFGNKINDYISIETPRVAHAPDGSLAASVIHVDRFGNLITNVTRDDVRDMTRTAMFVIEIRGRRITSVRETFGDSGAEELFAVWGSADRLEIVARCVSAARLLGVERGEPLLLRRVMPQDSN